MKSSSKIYAFLACICAFLFSNTTAMTAELIAPTRTLDGQEEPTGKLSVFSEPPDLTVILDGAEIGKTPVTLNQVKAGIHVLQLKEMKTKIFIEAGKSVRLSWFKGEFIEIADKKKEEITQPKAETAKQPAKTKTTAPAEKKEELLPLFWPLNPRGPIY